MQKNTPEYWLTHLHRSHVNGGAPHKPIMMLAILQLIDARIITSPLVRIDMALVLQFDKLWKALVNTPHKRSFALPFFHLKTEPFWQLHPKEGKEIPLTSSKSIKSFSALVDTLEYARLEDSFFLAASSHERNIELQRKLCETYFSAESPVVENDNLLEREIEQLLLFEPAQMYLKKQNLMAEDQEEEFRFIRSESFKQFIPRVYEHTCAISSLSITGHNYQMVDACHIKPFAEFGIDHISNGFCLTPTLHRAFDRGLLYVEQDFTVRISKSIVESESPYKLSQFNGAPLRLPKDKRLHPAIENFEWHRTNVAKLR